MTTPPTTAGWYPDPDGSGGQRYWDGAAWTDHGPDATDTPGATEETSAWPAELPPWPEDMTMPSWEEAGKAEPVSEVEPPEADVAPEPEAAEEPAEADEQDEPEVATLAAEEPDASADQSTAVVELVDQDQPTAVVTLPGTSAAGGPPTPAPAQPAPVPAPTQAGGAANPPARPHNACAGRARHVRGHHDCGRDRIRPVQSAQGLPHRRRRTAGRPGGGAGVGIRLRRSRHRLD